MRTLTLDEAADLLKTTPETVSAKIRDEGLPAAKVGRAWVLIDVDVMEWLRTRYAANDECESTNGDQAAPTGLASITAGARLDAALARPTRKPRRNTPTATAPTYGEPTDSANVRRLHGK